MLEVLQKVAGDEPPSLRSFSVRLPHDLQTICLKCLRKDPGQRYRSVAALADDLGRFLRGEPIHARRVGEAERVWKWVRRQAGHCRAHLGGRRFPAGGHRYIVFLRHRGATGREWEAVRPATKPRRPALPPRRRRRVAAAGSGRPAGSRAETGRAGRGRSGVALVSGSLHMAPKGDPLGYVARVNLTAWSGQVHGLRKIYRAHRNKTLVLLSATMVGRSLFANTITSSCATAPRARSWYGSAP